MRAARIQARTRALHAAARFCLACVVRSIWTGNCLSESSVPVLIYDFKGPKEAMFKNGPLKSPGFHGKSMKNERVWGFSRITQQRLRIPGKVQRESCSS